MGLQFRNVDCEITSSTKPVEFIRCLGRFDIEPMWNGGNQRLTAFEVHNDNTEASTLRAFQKLFASLTPKARAEWDRASQRVFDFGYSFVRKRHFLRVSVSPKFVAFAAALNARIVVTIYDENHSELKSRDR